MAILKSVAVRGYVWALCGIALGSWLAAPLRASIDLSNAALLYVLAVVVIGFRFGRGAAVLSAIVGSLAYAYVFVPPHFSLAITELQYVLSALIMLMVALVVGHLTSTLKRHAELVEQKSQQTRALYDLARQLTGALTPPAIAAITRNFLADSLRSEPVLFLFPEDFAQPQAPADIALVQACVERRRTVSRTQAERTLMLTPLPAASGVSGMIGIEAPSATLARLGHPELLATMASVVAVALERAHYAGIARETEIKHTAEALRSSILAALSHDLRTPLTALVGMADTLALGKASPERQRHMLESLRNQALSITQQMTNLLDMARLRSGTLELNGAWQPVEEVIGATLQLVREQWRDREVTVDLAAGLPPLYFDAVLIERVLWNLLENAIKYSPPEMPIEIEVRQIDSWVEISVADSGPGLPPGNIEDLFGVFRRGESESSIPGVGLGLSIARSITEAHGGTIDADNRRGGGACFRLRLPIGNPPSIDELDNEP